MSGQVGLTDGYSTTQHKVFTEQRCQFGRDRTFSSDGSDGDYSHSICYVGSPAKLSLYSRAHGYAKMTEVFSSFVQVWTDNLPISSFTCANF